MSTSSTLHQVHQSLYREATLLAGNLTDLNQRATVYRQIFRDSGRNHIFPLIAAHGALWAKGWFQFGFGLGRTLVWQYVHSAAKRAAQLNALAEFANDFRDINRRVCVDTYANFHFTARFGRLSACADFVAPELLEALNQVHAARRAGRELSDAQRRAVFRAHFLDEQEHVVGPAIAAALGKFDWPLLKAIALRPIIRFAYFPGGRRLWFRNFGQREERVRNGLTAFRLGAEVGWDRVEDALRDYQLLPARFFSEPDANFSELRTALLGS